MEKIVVIGGGPSGMMASYQIKKRHRDSDVILIDKTSIGKRIKISGNGRCNFSNDNIRKEFYHNGDFINDILIDYKNYEKEFYNEINLHFYSDEEGRRYPITDSSKTVLNLLSNALVKEGILIKENETFIDLKKINDQYLIKTNMDSYLADKVIFSIGGVSQLNDKDNYFNVINSIDRNIKINKLSSSLCPIKVKEKINKNVVGKRASVNVKVKYFDHIVYEEKGEVIFKKDGISGIVIFNISSFLASKNDLFNYKLILDFIDGISFEEINNQLKHFSVKEVLMSYVIDEIGEMILDRYKNIYIGLTNFELTCSEMYSLQDSQVTRGGICLSELNLNDLSFKNDKNIFFGGEMIDVDGRCGGYNIFFAFASGYRIGKSI